MSAMISSTTLFGAILMAGSLVYLGTLAIDPVHPLLRVIVGYICGAALILIGVAGSFYGASFELPLLYEGAYYFDPFHMLWFGLGVVSLVVGALIVRQAFYRR